MIDKRRIHFQILVLVLCLIIFSSILLFGDEPVKENDYVKFYTANYRSITSNDKVAVAVGEEGYISISYDAEKWIVVHSNTTNTINDIIWNGKEFIAVGDKGTLLTSNDGEKWNSIITNTTNNLLNVIVFNNKSIVSGEKGTILISNGGSKWEIIKTNINFAFANIAYNNGLFYAIVSDGQYYSSDNLKRWKKIGYSMDSICLVSNGKQLILTGQSGIYSPIEKKNSQHTILWNKINQTYYVRDLVWAKNKFIGISNSGDFVKSVDGVNWDESSFRTKGKFVGFRTIAYFKNIIIIAGENGMLFTSKDGIDWDNRSQKNINFKKVIFNGDKYIAIGFNEIWISLDCRNWVRVFDNASNYIILNDLLWNGKQYVVVGQRDFTAPVVLTSINGTDWSYKELNGHGWLMCIGWYKDKFISIDDSGNIYESDGDSEWRRNTCIDTHVTALNIDGDKLLVADSNGRIFTSSDGQTWNKEYVPTNSCLNSIASHNNTNIAVGNDGTILTQVGGNKWTSVILDSKETLNYVTYIDNSFIAVGEKGTVYISSQDGSNWNRFDIGSKYNLNFIGNCGSGLLVSGNNIVANIGKNNLPIVPPKQTKDYVDTKAGKYTWRDFLYGMVDGISIAGNGKIVVTNTGRYTTDGVSWQDPKIEINGRRIYYAENRFYVFNTYDSYESTDGITWSKININWPKKDFTYDLFDYFKVGKKNFWVASSHPSSVFDYLVSGEILSSSGDWNLKNSNIVNEYKSTGTSLSLVTTTIDGKRYVSKFERNPLYSISSNGKEYIAGGTNGALAYSKDGNTWSLRFANNTASFRKIIWDGKKYVAIGNESESYGSIMISTDGLKWKEVKKLMNSSFEDIIYDANGYFIIGNTYKVVKDVPRGVSDTYQLDAIVLYSDDLTNWSIAQIKNKSVKSIVKLKDKYIVLGEKITIGFSNENLNNR